MDPTEEPSPEASAGDQAKEDAAFPEGGQEGAPAEAEPRYTSESLKQILSPGETGVKLFAAGF